MKIYNEEYSLIGVIEVELVVFVWFLISCEFWWLMGWLDFVWFCFKGNFCVSWIEEFWFYV